MLPLCYLLPVAEPPGSPFSDDVVVPLTQLKQGEFEGKGFFLVTSPPNNCHLEGDVGKPVGGRVPLRYNRK